MRNKVISIALAWLMLILNLGFSINTHYCGGAAIKSTFNHGFHNHDCGMPGMDAAHNHGFFDGNQINKKPCCENQHQLLQLDEKTDIPNFNLEFSLVFILANTLPFTKAISYVIPETEALWVYVPPLPFRDFQSLYQVYLI